MTTPPPAGFDVDTPPPVVPVTRDDVVSGAARWLRTQADVLGVVGMDAFGAPLISQDRPPERNEFEASTALVVSYGGPMGSSPHTQLRRLRLQVDLWVDPIRDEFGAPVEPAETRRRIFAAFDAVNDVLHRVSHDTVYWGSVRTLDCTRLGDLTVYEVPATDGLLRGSCLYGVDVG